MAETRLIGSYPVIGIRPTIDGRRGKIKVRESLEDQTMNMAKSAAKLIEENVFYSNGEHAKVIIADTTIGRVAEAAACEDKFKKTSEGTLGEMLKYSAKSSSKFLTKASASKLSAHFKFSILEIFAVIKLSFFIYLTNFALQIPSTSTCATPSFF